MHLMTFNPIVTLFGGSNLSNRAKSVGKSLLISLVAPYAPMPQKDPLRMRLPANNSSLPAIEINL